MARNSSGFRKDSGDQSPRERVNQKEHAKDAHAYKGLCENCAKRDTCLLPKCEGGVWRCDQFVEDVEEL